MIIQGDCLTELKKLPDESVDCVVTSPPYWALRDYGVDGQLGLEPTFQEYISNLCDIFDEVKRVLKKEGTCWVNLGDTYANNGCYIEKYKETHPDHKDFHTNNSHRYPKAKAIRDPKNGVFAKSLIQIPSRFAIEMSNRGWILRNEIIWHKPNCMPSSVKDRFTVDFEKVFFFVKNKKYWFETQYEESLSSVQERKRNKRAVWKISTKPFKEAHFATYPEALIEPMIKAGCPVGGTVLDPFFGAGTTGIVAMKQGKKYIGIELNPEYIKIAEKRLAQEKLF